MVDRNLLLDELMNFTSNDVKEVKIDNTIVWNNEIETIRSIQNLDGNEKVIDVIPDLSNIKTSKETHITMKECIGCEKLKKKDPKHTNKGDRCVTCNKMLSLGANRKKLNMIGIACKRCGTSYCSGRCKLKDFVDRQHDTYCNNIIVTSIKRIVNAKVKPEELNKHGITEFHICMQKLSVNHIIHVSESEAENRYKCCKTCKNHYEDAIPKIKLEHPRSYICAVYVSCNEHESFGFNSMRIRSDKIVFDY